MVIDVRPDDRIPAKDAEAFAVTALACGLAGWEFRRAGDHRSGAAGERAVAVALPAPAVPGRDPVAAGLLEAFAGGRPLLAGAAQAGDPVAVLPVACSTCCGGASWPATCRCRLGGARRSWRRGRDAR